jgi:hypothetical protein
MLAMLNPRVDGLDIIRFLGSTTDRLSLRGCNPIKGERPMQHHFRGIDVADGTLQARPAQMFICLSIHS